MTNQDHLTEELNRELHRRVDHVHDAPLSFADVRGRAHRIRRRRRTTAAAALAAAVAVVAVVPAALSGGLHRADGPQPAPPVPPKSAHTAVLHDGRVTMPDGRKVSVDLDNADVSQFGVLADGRIVVANQKAQEIQVFAPDGSLEAEHPVDTLVLAMSATDQLAAWPDGSRVQVLESGSAEPVALAHMPKLAGTIPMLDAVTGDHCAEGGCRAILSDGTETAAEVTVDGLHELATSEPLRVTEVSPDGTLWAVTLPGVGSDPQFPCAGLYDPGADRVVARNCNYASNLKFSPDGQYLAGAEGDNNMYGEVDVFDLGLERVGTWSPQHGVVSRYAWADATHLLASTVRLRDNQWSLVRVALNFGEPEVVEGPVAGRNPDMLVEFLPSE